MNQVAVAIAVIVVGTHYGYYLFDDKQGWFYVLRGIEGTALFLLLAHIFRRHWPVAAACFFGAFEEVQTALCGFADPVNGMTGICVELVGPVPYAAAAAAAFVYLAGSRKWLRSRKASQQPPR